MKIKIMRTFDFLFIDKTGATVRYSVAGLSLTEATVTAEELLSKEHPNFDLKSTNICERSNQHDATIHLTRLL
jgi:hypothetical protein